MTNSPPAATANLDAAIENYSNQANAQYQDAQTVIDRLSLVAELSDAQKQELSDAEKQLAGAFSQLTTAATLQADQTDRAGFSAVVRLMEATAENATAISGTMTSLARNAGTTPTPALMNLINTLTSALEALAELSPSDAWTSPKASERG